MNTISRAILLGIAFKVLCPAALVYGQHLEWANAFRGVGSEFAHDIAVDHQKNIYITGDFSRDTDFDPGPAVLNISPLTDNAFLLKTDSLGNLIWFRNAVHKNTTHGNGYAGAVTTDVNGNVYITGHFNGGPDFDPGPALLSLSSAGKKDAFICKYSGDGNLIWAKTVGGSEDDKGHDISVDPFGNVTVVGSFLEDADFDPNPDSSYILSTEFVHGFALTLDSDGNFIRAVNIGGVNSSTAHSCASDEVGNIYVTGYFRGIVDFDPGPAVSSISSQGFNAFVLKLNHDGTFGWAKAFRGGGYSIAYAVALGSMGDTYIAGSFNQSQDFNPSTTETYYLHPYGLEDIFVVKLNHTGNLVWVGQIGGTASDICGSISLDANDNVYISGHFAGIGDFDPGVGTYSLSSAGSKDGFIAKIDKLGRFDWAFNIGGPGGGEVMGVVPGNNGQIYCAGYFDVKADFDPSDATFNLYGLSSDMFMANYSERGVRGFVSLDRQETCLFEAPETGLAGRLALIQPGNIIVETNSSGSWSAGILPVGNYTITYDTSGNWRPVCSPAIPFEVTDTNTVTRVPEFGLASTLNCTEPAISIIANLRRCNENTLIKIKVCNGASAPTSITNSFVEFVLDPVFTCSESSLPYLPLGNNTYWYELPEIAPGACHDFWVKALINCDAPLLQTVCAIARLFPADSCVYDEPGWISSPGDPPCFSTWDQSHVIIEGWCADETIHFAITNTAEEGVGDMTCMLPTRLYVDGKFLLKDSVRLQGGHSDTAVFDGDGRTWRMEVDQHPLHPGRSKPNVTVERCGSESNMSPEMSLLLADDDEDKVIDIFCGPITGSLDPNDKIGHPTGVGDTHGVMPNGKIDYVIRFQNTGNDTAFKVVILDTLDQDLDIFSVRNGASSHNHTFRMYGPRVLEWTFEPIMLPDSAANQEGSNGFVTFSVFQNRDLPDGTEITNSAAIYFDFNDPVITNATLHTIDRMINSPSWTETKEVTLESCDDISYNNLRYTSSGTYWQVVEGGVNTDTLVTLNVLLPEDVDNSMTQNGATLSSSITGATYQWFNCDVNSLIPNETTQNFTASTNGNYALIITQNGCVDTSDCYVINLVGTIDNAFVRSLSVYPNPNDGSFTIDFGNVLSHTEISVFNTLGKMVFNSQYQNTSQETLNLIQESGVYFVQVQAGNEVGLLRIVVQHVH